jgi:hypothetical protein
MGKVKVTIRDDISHKGVFRKSTEYRTEINIEGEGNLAKLSNNLGTYIENRDMNAYRK